VEPSWERNHPGQPERWGFDFFAPDGSIGGFASLTFHPDQFRGWYWAALVGRGRPYLLVRELNVALPRFPGSRQVRAEALWADMNCETPFDHWSLGLEAFGVAMDDPGEALNRERGDLTGLALDLEWEAVAGVTGGEGAYDQPCDVHGEVLVGAGSDVESIAFEGHGWRRHAWGSLPCLEPGWAWLGGCLKEGTPWRAVDAGGGVQPLHEAPLLLERPRPGVLRRRLALFQAPDGRSGVGWAERVTA
jgi:hypothetical protein